MNTRNVSLVFSIIVLLCVPSPLAAYEAILIPVSGPPAAGGFGTLWVTEHALYVAGSTAMIIGRSDCILSPCGETYAPDRSYRVRPSAFSDGYLVLGVFVGDTSDLVVTSIVRDVSRSVEPWGTTIPVARDSDFGPRVNLLDIPVQPGFRLTLRAFGLPRTRDATTFVIRIYEMEENTFSFVTPRPDVLLAETERTVNGSHLLLNEVEALAPGSAGRLRIEIREASGRPVWGFVSATNNETQHVTVFAPR